MYPPSLRLDFHCCVIFTGEPTSIKLPSPNQYIYVQDVWRSACDLQSCAKSGGTWRGLIFTFNWRANSSYQSPLFYWRAYLLTLMKITRQGKSTDTQNWRGYGWNLKSNEIAKICRRVSKQVGWGGGGGYEAGGCHASSEKGHNTAHRVLNIPQLYFNLVRW